MFVVIDGAVICLHEQNNIGPNYTIKLDIFEPVIVAEIALKLSSPLCVVTPT